MELGLNGMGPSSSACASTRSRNPNPFPVHAAQSSRVGRESSSLRTRACFSSLSHGNGIGLGYPPKLRCAVLGAGFAGLSVTWYLLQKSSKDTNLHVDLFDEVGLGGGASGISGGLLHPYSPKVKLLWRGEECWNECLSLLSAAERAAGFGELSSDDDPLFRRKSASFIVRRSGILRPAVNEKHLDIMHQNAQKSLARCQVESIDTNAAQHLVPSLCTPLNTAFFMPNAVNVYPQRYLQGLFLACQKVAAEISGSGYAQRSLCLHKKMIASLNDLAEYDVVIVCLGARVDMLPELSGILPLRMCRGIIAHMHLPDRMSEEEYPDGSPSILSDTWMAIQGPRNLHLGSTWEWGSRNYSTSASMEEISSALEELMPKARTVYPLIDKWRIEGAKAGLRAMPPLTCYGSLPLAGSIDDIVSSHTKGKYWLIGGLGSRGLLYHGWLGKLTAEAVLARNEDLIPSELTSWKKKKR